MYHIKKDKRSEYSDKLITEGLLECLKSKNLSDITVSDIQRASSVGRTTFYRHFDCVTDVLEYKCDQIFNEIAQQNHKYCFNSAEEIVKKFIQIWYKNEHILEAVVKNNRIDIIINSHRKNQSKMQNVFFRGKKEAPEQTEYIIIILSYIMAGVLSEWIRNGTRETCSQLYEQIRECIKLLQFVFI
ncbi:MAG TPA: hypothetical protein DCL73_09985 [Treponema sp.]|mgnify:CR=1 FL=1|nr:hypothetical protein [Treponema sp.]